MKEQGTLDPKINLNVQSGMENLAVQSALKTINDDLIVYPNRDRDYKRILDFVEKGYILQEPGTARVFESQAILQALWRFLSRMKPLDCAIHGSGVSEDQERLVSEGVGTCMSKGGFVSELRDKQGVFMTKMLLGDCFLQIGINQDEDFPIEFRSTSPGSVFVNRNATTIRGRGGKGVTKLVKISSYSWGEACKHFPELKKKGGAGKIPRGGVAQYDTAKTLNQETFDDGTDVEIAYSYDIANRNFCIFAGTACTVLKEVKDDEYPFIEDKKDYIPMLHFSAFPAVKGFWNYGIGHIMYSLAIVQRRLLNAQTLHVTDNANPTRVASLPAGTSEKFIDDYIEAEQAKADGYQGLVTVEYDSIGGNKVDIQSLTTDNLTQANVALWDKLSQELARFGINLDDIDRGDNVTATQINAEEDAQNAIIKQISEWNASEYEKAIGLTMDAIKQWVPDGSEVPINSTTAIRVGGTGQVKVDTLNLGDVKEELETNNYFPKVNARTGTYPSNTYKQAQINKMLSYYPPGSPAFLNAVVELGGLNDREIKIEDLSMQPQGPPQGAPDGEMLEPGAEGEELGLEGVLPAETERTNVDASNKSIMPAL